MMPTKTATTTSGRPGERIHATSIPVDKLAATWASTSQRRRSFRGRCGGSTVQAVAWSVASGGLELGVSSISGRFDDRWFLHVQPLQPSPDLEWPQVHIQTVAFDPGHFRPQSLAWVPHSTVLTCFPITHRGLGVEVHRDSRLADLVPTGEMPQPRLVSNHYTVRARDAANE